LVSGRLPEPYYESPGLTIYHGDCRELLPSIDERVDAVVTDPPYGDTALDWDRALGLVISAIRQAAP